MYVNFTRRQRKQFLLEFLPDLIGADARRNKEEESLNEYGVDELELRFYEEIVKKIQTQFQLLVEEVMFYSGEGKIREVEEESNVLKRCFLYVRVRLFRYADDEFNRFKTKSDILKLFFGVVIERFYKISIEGGNSNEIEELQMWAIWGNYFLVTLYKNDGRGLKLGDSIRVDRYSSKVGERINFLDLQSAVQIVSIGSRVPYVIFKERDVRNLKAEGLKLAIRYRQEFLKRDKISGFVRLQVARLREVYFTVLDIRLYRQRWRGQKKGGGVKKKQKNELISVVFIKQYWYRHLSGRQQDVWRRSVAAASQVGRAGFGKLARVRIVRKLFFR
jgi:hypothetical protein